MHLCAHAWKCALSGGVLDRIHPCKALARARQDNLHAASSAVKLWAQIAACSLREIPR